MKYATEKMNEILKSPEARKIIDYMTPCYGEAYVGLWLLQVIGMELDDLRLWTNELRKQITPIEATWGLYYFALGYGVEADSRLIQFKPGEEPDEETQDIIDRARNQIMVRIQERAPANPARIESIISTICVQVSNIGR